MKTDMLAYLRGQRSCTLHRLPWKVLRLLKFLFEVAQASLFPPVISDKEMQQALVPGFTMDCLPRRIRSATGVAFFVDPAEREQRIALLHQVAPDAPTFIVAKADQVREHVFDLLGSGPTPLGDRIDWHTDFKSGHRWDPNRYYRCHKPASYPGGHDIKVPWDLSDCHHFTWLGQAYWITEDEKYAQEFVDQVTDWIVQNAPQFGVNWTCAMKIAIRAVNWLCGLHFFRLSPTIADDFLLELARSLLVHGRHIMSNLEGSRENQYTSNHYLGNLVGLIYLGICCPFFKEAQQWLEFGTSELWNEMFKQVYPDGVDYEGSIPYHRLVTEMFLSTVLLCRRNGIAVPQAVRERLEKMLEFTMYVTKPDGTVPLIGDNDNGRLHRLTVWEEPEREWIDHRYLLAIGAVLFERDDFGQAAGNQWEEAIWLFGEKALAFKREVGDKDLPPLRLESRAFPDAGIYIMRHDDLYMVVDAGPNRQNGKSAHAHNGVLSFELYADGQTWIVDPGSYVYTQDWEARNRFRGTGFHNTVQVDTEEIRKLDVRRVFRMESQVPVEVNDWRSSSHLVLLDAQYTGYGHLSFPVTHRRVFIFLKRFRSIIIWDHLWGEEEHTFTAGFHCAPHCVARTTNTDVGRSVVVTSPNDAAELDLTCLDSKVMPEVVEDGVVSPGYGHLLEGPVIRYCAEPDDVCEFSFIVIPYVLPCAVPVQAIRQHLMTALTVCKTDGVDSLEQFVSRLDFGAL